MENQYVGKIGSKGEIFPPKEVREYLEFNKDQPVLMTVYPNRLIIQKIDTLEKILSEPAKAKISYHALKKLESAFDWRCNWWVHLYETDVVLKLKEIHSDSIDCTLIYLAVVNCDIYATFDDMLINKLKDQQFIQQFITETNPRFKIWSRNLIQDPFSLLPQD